MTSGSEREAFLLWMSSPEKDERERIATRKQAVSMLEKAIGEQGRDSAHRSSLTSTLRRWKGIVAREEGDWAVARFEFLQGRNLAESFDPGNVPWFDAAITEAEIWEAFAAPGLEVDGLAELVEKLDRTSGLYGLAGDRAREEFTAEWARWFRFFLVPAVPAPALVARIVEELKRLEPGPAPGTASARFPLGDYIFAWRYFWFSALAHEAESLLKAIFVGTSTLEESTRGASALAPPPAGFVALPKPDTPRRERASNPGSSAALFDKIRADLDALHETEKEIREYVSKVRGLWDSATHQKKMEVERAMHPGKQRR